MSHETQTNPPNEAPFKGNVFSDRRFRVVFLFLINFLNTKTMEGKNESKHTPEFTIVTCGIDIANRVNLYGVTGDWSKESAEKIISILASAPALLEENQKLKTKMDRLSFLNKTLQDATEKLQTEIEHVQKENETLMTGQDTQAVDLVRLMDEVDRLTKEKSELVEALENLWKSNPNDESWNYIASWDAAMSLLNRIK